MYVGEKIKMKKNFLYIGGKIRLINPDILCGSAKDFYMKHGYVYVQDIWDNGIILVGSGMGVGVSVTCKHIDGIIIDDNILEVLQRKKRDRDKIQKDIQRIEEYINWKCNLKGEVK